MAKGVRAKLAELGFRRFAKLRRTTLEMDTKLPQGPGVYVGVLGRKVFWVGETGDIRRRFSGYRQWLNLPPTSKRRDKKRRDELLRKIGSKTLVFHFKSAKTFRSKLTNQNYPAHRWEEQVLIDYFKPEWNKRR